MEAQALQKSVDPDHIPQNLMPDEGLHCLPCIQALLNVDMSKKLVESSSF